MLNNAFVCIVMDLFLVLWEDESKWHEIKDCETGQEAITTLGKTPWTEMVKVGIDGQVRSEQD